jgi:hypothetical protein
VCTSWVDRIPGAETATSARISSLTSGAKHFVGGPEKGIGAVSPESTHVDGGGLDLSEKPPSNGAQVRESRPTRSRRHVSVPTVVAWASVVIFALVGIGSPLLGRAVFLGTDILTGFAPWASQHIGNGSITNNWLGDTIDSMAPQTVLLKHSVLDGNFAQWNPYVAGGTPLGALPNMGLFSPVSWVWFLVPDSYAPGAAKLVEIVVSVVGMALFTRRLGLSSAARAVSALVFVSSGFMIAWTNWPQTRVAALVPLLFWAVDRVVCRRRWRDALPLALVFASMLLGGFPAVVGYAVYGVLAYAVVRLLALRAGRVAWVRSAVLGVSGAALGVGLAAWQLVPFLVNAISVVDFSSRAQTSDIHIAWSALSTAVVPGILSGPNDPVWGGSGNPIERFSYLGAATVVLVGAAFVVRSRRRTVRAVKLYAIVAAGICALLIYGGGPVLALAQRFPVFSNNYVGRLGLMLGFFIAVCAGYGFNQIQEPVTFSEELRSRPGSRARALLAAPWIVVGLSAIGLAVLVRTTLYLAPAQAIGQVREGTIVVAGLVALCGLLVLLAWSTKSRTWASVVGVIIPVVLVGQALFVVHSWWPQSPLASFYPPTATTEFLSHNLGAERYITVGQTMLPGTSSMYKLRAANGHAFQTSQMRDLLVAADAGAMRSATYSVTSLAGLTSPALDRMAVRYGVADPGMPIPGRQELLGKATSTAVVGPSGSILSGPFTAGVRGVFVDLPQGLAVDRDGGLRVTVVAQNGTVLASTTRLVRATHAATTLWVALAAEDIGPGVSARVKLEGLHSSSMVVPIDHDGSWAVTLLRAQDDLKVVHTGDTTIYERKSATSRFRWASLDRVVVDEQARVRLLSSGKVPATTVVLERAADAPNLVGSSSASVDAVTDDADHLKIAVDAKGSGFLVVADAMRVGGWTASVDGRASPLLPADEAFSAVYLGSGRHVVDLTYEAPGLRLGTVISAVSIIVLLFGASWIAIGPRLRRRRARAAKVSG